MTRPTRALAVTAFLGWLGAVGVLTLNPTGNLEPLTWRDFFCLWCSSRPGADLILNWALFLPGGVLLQRMVGTRRAVVVGFLITAGIEGAQLLIPGRHPAFTDLAFNTLGAASGAWLGGPGRSPRTLSVAAVVAAAAWLAPAVLLVPRPTDAPLYALWTPDFGGAPRYRGTVLQAEVAGGPTAFRLDDSPRVARALARRAPVEVRFVVGPRPPRSAPLYGLYDANTVQNLLVGVLGDDLIVRGNTVARSLGLDQPDIRWRGALSGAAPGDTLLLTIHVPEDERCLELSGERRCDVVPAAGDGYAFLLNLEGLPAAGHLLLALAWAAVLGALVGLAFSTVTRGLAAGVAVAALGALAAAWSPDLRLDLAHTTALVAGAALGPALRSLVLGGSGSGEERHGQRQVLLHQDPAP